jgi:hypothetical protein
MKFRNHWIDPRIIQVRPENAQAYLTRRGWRLVGPASDPSLLRYEIEGDESAPTLFVPIRVDSGPGVQWMIELVADLARFENRWAVDVLQDMLREPTDSAAANGPPVPAKAEPAPKG